MILLFLIIIYIVHCLVVLLGKPEGRRPRRRWVDTGLREESGFPDPADRKLSANLYDIYHCCEYSEKLLMMDRGTVRNM